MVKVSKNSDQNWSNDAIQFPRLIAEMEAMGVFAIPSVLPSLAHEMDLTVDQLCDLINRAQEAWEGIKTQTKS
jgi:hypothetical protein